MAAKQKKLILHVTESLCEILTPWKNILSYCVDPQKTVITAQKPHHLSPPLAPQPWLSSACRKPPALLETNVQVHPIRTSLLLPWSHCTKTIPLFTTLKEEHLQNAKHLQTKLRKNLFPASCPPYHSFHIFHSLHGFKSFYNLQDFHGLQSI